MVSEYRPGGGPLDLKHCGDLERHSKTIETVDSG
jgi:hypothetical protein